MKKGAKESEPLRPIALILVRTIFISCNALGYVLLDVVVEELVVILMEAGWSEEICPFGDW